MLEAHMPKTLKPKQPKQPKTPSRKKRKLRNQEEGVSVLSEEQVHQNATQTSQR